MAKRKLKFIQGPYQVSMLNYPQPPNICMGVGVVDESVKEGTYTRMICNTILPETDEQYEKEAPEIEGTMQLLAASWKMLQALRVAISYTPSDSDARKQIAEAIAEATKNVDPKLWPK